MLSRPQATVPAWQGWDEGPSAGSDVRPAMSQWPGGRQGIPAPKETYSELLRRQRSRAFSEYGHGCDRRDRPKAESARLHGFAGSLREAPDIPGAAPGLLQNVKAGRRGPLPVLGGQALRPDTERSALPWSRQRRRRVKSVHW